MRCYTAPMIDHEWSRAIGKRADGPPASQRLGVLGGSFDPVHVGHMIVAEILRHRLDLDRVIVLPAGRPPHKPSRVLASDEDRVTMLELSFDGAPHFEISTIDLDRPGWSYTSDSLRLIREQQSGDCELVFLMGQDSLRDFPNWHRPDLIVQQAHLGVARRPDVEVSVESVHEAVPETRGRITLVDIPLIGISSRGIRASIRAGGPFRFQVVPAVADYIEANGLYLETDTIPEQATHSPLG